MAKPLFGSAKLVIGGRDQTKLVAALTKQVELVTQAVAGVAEDVPVRGAFCFVEPDLPLLRTLSVNGYPLLHRRSLPKRLNADGPLTADAIGQLSSTLRPAFPSLSRKAGPSI
ncbi:MAG: hypothetical protein WD399_07300 [Thermoleophilaceae bacterium]